ncbi:type II methionyl aminopeptidase [Candidatus Pacearchaeota archaeon]|nr:type II methionyl aminopeptidase [Candidatus Pacearchaeota archaeon]
MSKEKIFRAGKIAAEAKEYARKIIKKGMFLLEIADKVEGKIIELGGKPGFPLNLSVNDEAAHYTPSYNDTKIAEGLLKVDLGVHVDGFIADTAFSLDLENSEVNKKLIEAAKAALENAIKTAKINTEVGKIGKAIQETIKSRGFSPIVNLGGHGITRYEVHSGIMIPNIDNKSKNKLEEGQYAIEPFATNGNGKIHDGKPSGIYELRSEKNIRSSVAREVLEFIINEYKTLPFCSRWLVRKIGTKALIGLKQLEENGNLYHHPVLVETSKGIVAQAEHTILIEKDKTTVTTE